MNYKQRYMGYFDLSDKLRDLKRRGVQVPTLETSPFLPEFLGNCNGVEVYRHGGREIQVGPGHVIDSHGNVVNLQGLEAQASIVVITPIQRLVDSRPIEFAFTELSQCTPNDKYDNFSPKNKYQIRF